MTMEIDKDFLGKLFEQAVVNPRFTSEFRFANICQ